MDILSRLLGHDHWTTAQLLQRCAALSPAQLQMSVAVGYGNLTQTFDHMVGNVEAWTDLMLARQSRDIEGNSPLALLERWNAAYAEFATLARELQNQNRLNDCYTDVLDNPPRQKSFGGTILHVITHNHQHRAEAIHMLNQLGVPDVIEGDLLDWERLAKDKQGD